MDTIWNLRQGYAIQCSLLIPKHLHLYRYESARKIKVQQDQFCEKAVAGQWQDLGEFPEDLQWEALVDVLRGRVKIQVHIYEAVDLDAIVRVSVVTYNLLPRMSQGIHKTRLQCS
jgi:hypothetical protein